jgi:CheY-like chemotaxis protein
MTASHVLLVDDNKSIQDLYRTRLARELCRVTVVENGLEAVKLLLAQPEEYQLVILDLLVPLIDGYKVLQVIRSHPQLKTLPVIVFSAKVQPEEIERAMTMGATDYLNKTMTKPDDLVVKVKQLLGAAHPTDAPESARPAPRYRLQIKDTAMDAPQLAQDFGLSPFFTCLRCENELVLELAVERREPLEVRGRLVCLRCGS